MNVESVSVQSDLYNAGLTEDGQEYHAETFYVVVEFPDGRRLAHTQKFNGCKRFEGYADDEYVVAFEDVRVEAREKAEHLRASVEAHLNSGGTLDLSFWVSMPSAYGSQAYINIGDDLEMRAWERNQNGYS